MDRKTERTLRRMVKNRAAAMVLTDSQTEGYWDDAEAQLGREPTQEERTFLERTSQALADRLTGALDVV